MKLPSGREISIHSLADVVEMLATESFHLENIDSAEEVVSDDLCNESFSLSGTEKPFANEDIAAIMSVVRPVAEDIGCALTAKMEEFRPHIETAIAAMQKKVVSAEVKHKLLIHLQTLSVAVSGLSKLYDEHPELNEGVDISNIIPMLLDEWDAEITAKIGDLEGAK